MILFDLSYFSHRIIYPNKDAILQNPLFFAHLLTSQIISFSKKMGASKQNKMILCLDSFSWRKEYYETNKVNFPEYNDKTYKGNRVKDPEIPWDHINDTTTLLVEAFKEYSDFYVMKVNNAEADDIIAVLANTFKKQETIWILSPDKDFVQLQDKNVFIFDPLKNGFKPEQDIEIFKKIHNIIGDTSDNILAIKPRCKEITAGKMLKDLDDLLATNPGMKARYEFNKNLIDLSMIPDIVQRDILLEFDTQSHEDYHYNYNGLIKTFMKFGLSKLSEDINNFKLSENEIKTPLNQYFIDGEKNAILSRNNLEDFFD